MGKVIGPFNEDDWHYLRRLNSSIAFYKNEAASELSDALRIETKAYKTALRPYLAA